MNYSDVITIEPGKRGGKPCIRGLRITVYDVLEYLASGMSHADVLREFPYLTEEDIRACLAYAADRERKADIADDLGRPVAGRQLLHFQPRVHADTSACGTCWPVYIR